MEDLIGILFAVGFIVFKIWTGMKGETEEAAPTTTSQTDWEEEKPFNPEEVEWMDETTPTMRPVQAEEQPQKARSLSELLASLGQTPRTEKVKRTAVKPVKADRPIALQPTTTKHSDQSIGRRLQSPQEVRRAFIYSEIFKRKY